MSGEDAVKELPPQYLDREKRYSPIRQKGKTYCFRAASSTSRLFRSAVFNISPRDAESMNPHQRLVLQEGWKALEDAGYNPRSLAGARVGVFVSFRADGLLPHETFVARPRRSSPRVFPIFSIFGVRLSSSIPAAPLRRCASSGL